MTDVRLARPSASSWGRRELCAASLQLEAEARRLNQVAHQDSEAAQTGSSIHLAIKELGDLGAIKTAINDKDADSAAILKSRGDEQIERIFSPRQPEILRERRLWMRLNDQPALSGQFDLVAYYPATSPTLALIQDYKTGFREPDPIENNAQMKALALLVGLNLPTVQEVVVQLVSGPYGVTESRYSMAQLGVIYDETVAVLRRLDDPDAIATPSPEACRFCTAKLICQAFRDQVVTPMVKLTSVSLPKEPDRASRVLDEMDMLYDFLDEVKAYYSALLKDDPTYKIPGWELVPGNTVREVSDWDAARSRLSEYLPIENLRSAAYYRLGELEKGLGKVLKLKGAPLRDRMNEILKGLVIEKQNASSLKRVKGRKTTSLDEHRQTPPIQ